MIKNKYKFYVFSIAFFILLLMLAATPTTENSNKFIAGMCLGFMLSPAVFLLWTQEHKEEVKEEKDNNINKNHPYNNEYWWNSGTPPKFTDRDGDGD
jgi:hypothetical protein